MNMSFPKTPLTTVSGHTESTCPNCKALQAENGRLRSQVWRVFPDEDGENGETWGQFAADTDMRRMVAEREAEALHSLLRECIGGVTLDDPRLSYVEVQVPRRAYEAVKRLEEVEA